MMIVLDMVIGVYVIVLVYFLMEFYTDPVSYQGAHWKVMLVLFLWPLSILCYAFIFWFDELSYRKGK